MAREELANAIHSGKKNKIKLCLCMAACAITRNCSFNNIYKTQPSAYKLF